MTPRRAASLALLLSLGIGCGDDDASMAMGDAAVAPRALPADVERALQLHCQPCHADPVMRFAPMPLVTWEQVHAPAPTDPDRAVFELIAERVASERFPMPPMESPELAAITPEQQRLLLDWASMGAPAADQ